LRFFHFAYAALDLISTLMSVYCSVQPCLGVSGLTGEERTQVTHCLKILAQQEYDMKKERFIRSINHNKIT
jgi:hypothetical protein